MVKFATSMATILKHLLNVSLILYHNYLVYYISFPWWDNLKRSHHHFTKQLLICPLWVPIATTYLAWTTHHLIQISSLPCLSCTIENLSCVLSMCGSVWQLPSPSPLTMAGLIGVMNAHCPHSRVFVEGREPKGPTSVQTTAHYLLTLHLPTQFTQTV